MSTIFSPSRNVFFNQEWRTQYEDAGSWPSDGLEVSPDTFLEFGVGTPPLGKVRSSDGEGMPIWVDAPASSDDALAAGARQQRDVLLRISDWTQLGDIAEETKTRWAIYRAALRNVCQQSGFPREIVWPEKPVSDV